MMKTLGILIALGASVLQAQGQDLDIIRSQRHAERLVLSKAMPHAAHVQASQADSLVLVNLYNLTQGASWVQRTGWLSDPVSGWHGVALSPTGRVVGLDLQANGLSGTLPDSLGSLDSLRTLYLADNFITGGMPASIGELTSLRTLSLWSNALSGSIPASLGQLVHLRDLLLFDNNFSGPIPESVGGLIALDRLWLDFNTLEGPIPASLANLTQLTEFFLDANKLSGQLPGALSGLRSVISLYAGHNRLDGPIPPDLGSLPALQNLSLAGNSHSGPVPTELAQVPNLVKLLLSGNQLTGGIPPQLATRQKLTTVELARNNLSGPIPQEVGAIRELRILDLSHNQLTGALPGSLGWATALHTLNVAGNQLSGTLPSSLSSLTRMQALDLSGNRLEGGIEPIYSMTRLRVVRLGQNNFSGALGAGFGFMQLLEEANLADNAFSGTLDQMFKRPTPLKVLHIGGNNLEGDVPPEVTQSSQLTDLRLPHNRLEGLPPLAALPLLDTLDVSYNRFTFEDLEYNASAAPGGFIYAPQDSADTALAHEGADYIFTVSVGGTQSAYQWHRDGMAIAGATSDTLRILASDPEAGYHCVITNTLLPALTLTSRVRSSTDIPNAQVPATAPWVFALQPNYPNPFRSRTMITLEVAREVHATVTIYDLLGRSVMRLLDRRLLPGRHDVPVDATLLVPGTYMYRVTAGEFRAAHSMVRIR